jgi:hypothetical protein
MSSDAQRFLIAQADEQEALGRMVVVLNWPRLLTVP